MIKKCTALVLTLLALLTCQPLTAYAGRITMQLSEQEETESGKTLCRYENSFYSQLCDVEQALPQLEKLRHEGFRLMEKDQTVTLYISLLPQLEYARKITC